MIKVINYILSITLVIQAALFQIALPNLILCIGNTGHVALEWQEKQEHCRHDNLVSKIIFDSIENIHSGSQEVDCKDINLHFHSSFASKVQKENIIVNIEKTYVQKDLLATNNFRDSRIVSLEYPNYTNPTIDLVKTFVLTI
jgi:hypothetical protein